MPTILKLFDDVNALQSGGVLMSENARLYKQWLTFLPIIDELVVILTKFGSKFVFEPEDFDFKLDYWYLYIDCVLPRLYLDAVFADLNPKNSREKLKILIKHSFLYTTDLQRFVILGPELLSYGEQFEIDASEKALFKDNVLLESFLNEITLGISYETTRFLIFNPLIDIEELRGKLYKFSIYIMCFLVSQRYL